MKQFDYTKKDIINSLKKIGLKYGDNIFIHSNIGYFGKLEDENGKEDYCKTFKDSIFDVIGINGTIIVPSFSYSFCNNQFYDKLSTKSMMGIFSEYIREQTNSFRSDDANFSVSAIGKNAKKFTDNVSVHSFGNDSFWDRFLNANGKICNFNLDSASTFIHYVEKMLKVPYRFEKPFTGWTVEEGERIQKTYFHFVYDLSKPENMPDFSKFDKKAKNSGIVVTSNLGRGQIICISARDTYELIKKEICEQNDFLIKGSKVEKN